MSDDTIIEGVEIAEAIAEETCDWEDENAQEIADMGATQGDKSGEPQTMDFHVQMRSYTLANLEQVIIEAAAKQVRTGLPANTDKLIQEKAIELADKAITAKLEPITRELFDQPMLSTRYREKEPLTLSEYIGLVGKDFLTTRVKRDGTPTTSSYDHGEPRINRIIAEVLEKRFQKEISEAFADLRNHVKARLDVELNAVIEAERKRLADSLGYELQKRR